MSQGTGERRIRLRRHSLKEWHPRVRVPTTEPGTDGRQVFPATRNPEGNSLDDARAEFRAEWDAQVARLERANARRRRGVEVLNYVTEIVLALGALLGILAGGALGVLSGNLAMFLEGVMLGALIGCGATVPVLLLIQFPAWVFRWQIHRAEALLRDGLPLE